MIATFSLASCKKTEEAVPAEEAAEAEEAVPAEEAAEAEEAPLSGELEIFSWWTHGGEVDALNALFEIYKKRFPNVEIINATVAGGAGFNAKAVLVTRMQGGDPPESFQVHAGQELIGTWVGTGLIEPINFIFEENNWLDVYPADIIDIISQDGKIWSVPVNIHRSNVMWYNKEVFESNGLQVPKTFDEFFAVAEELKALGITPITLGSKEIWTATHLFEDVLLGVLGAEGYRGLFDGSVRWDSPEVIKAIETFVKVLDVANKDHSALLWDEAVDLVIDGSAATTIMGDWAEGYMKAKGWAPGVEFGWAPSPGTEGSFMMLSDSFSLPTNIKNRDAAIGWLEVVGSKEGQDAFNPIKGSIPPRTDIDVSLYDPYLQSSIKDYATNELVPSIKHGAAVSEPWAVEIDNVMTMLVSDRNVEAAAVKFQSAADEFIK